MAVTIAALVGTTNSAATGRGHQSHLVYGTNSGQWWLAYQSAATVITFLRSADFATWSAGGTYALTGASTPIDGRGFALAYLNKASTDIIHVSTCELTASTVGSGYHGRVTLGATALTTSNADAAQQASGTTGVALNTYGVGSCLDANDTPVDFNTLNHRDVTSGWGNMMIARATNADAGTSWSAGFPTPVNLYTVPNSVVSSAVRPLGAGTPAPVLMVCDNTATTGTFTNLFWLTYTNQTTATAGNVLASAVASQNANDWGLARVSATDVHAVARSGANAFVHRRFNGTAWSAGQTIPGMTTGPKAGSGLFLAPDGANLWFAAIDSGAANKVQILKWTAATPAWDAAWTDVETSTAVRNFISGYPGVVNGQIGLIWTQANGSNFDVAGALYPASAGATAAGSGVAAGLAGGLAAGAAGTLAPGTAAGPLGGTATGAARALAAGGAGVTGAGATGAGLATSIAPGSATGLDGAAADGQAVALAFGAGSAAGFGGAAALGLTTVAETLACATAVTPDNWTLGAGTSKVAALAGPDDDVTSYVNSGTTSGTQQQFALADPAAFGTGSTINSVTIRARCARGGSQNAGYVVTAVLGANTTDGATQSTTASYATTNDVVARPGGGAWTYEDLVALQVRIRNTQARDVRCTTLAVDVVAVPAAPVGTQGTGPGAAAAVGAGVAAGVLLATVAGGAAGVGPAAGAGLPTATAAGLAAGVGAGAGAGLPLILVVGATSGAGAAAGGATTSSLAPGTAAGLAGTAAAGLPLVTGTGGTAGAGAAAGIGGAVPLTVGVAAGLGAAAGAGAGLAAGVGRAAGAGGAVGRGAPLVRGPGIAAGLGGAAGTAPAVGPPAVAYPASLLIHI